MKTLNLSHRLLMIVGLLAAPILTNGCSGTIVDGGGNGGGGSGSGSGANDCVVGGCSGQLCVEPGDNGASTCEWIAEYACYKQVGVCERNASNQCGWQPSQALQDCIDAARNPPPVVRMPASGPCIRNSTDTCTTDADCKTGGCGGELCEGKTGQGVTTCDCTTPQNVSCGCVNGTCLWWQ